MWDMEDVFKPVASKISKMEEFQPKQSPLEEGITPQEKADRERLAKFNNTVELSIRDDAIYCKILKPRAGATGFDVEEYCEMPNLEWSYLTDLVDGILLYFTMRIKAARR